MTGVRVANVGVKSEIKRVTEGGGRSIKQVIIANIHHYNDIVLCFCGLTQRFAAFPITSHMHTASLSILIHIHSCFSSINVVTER